MKCNFNLTVLFPSCIEIILAEELATVKSKLADISTLESAEQTAEERLSFVRASLRGSKVSVLQLNQVFSHSPLPSVPGASCNYWHHPQSPCSMLISLFKNCVVKIMKNQVKLLHSFRLKCAFTSFPLSLMLILNLMCPLSQEKVKQLKYMFSVVHGVRMFVRTV